MEAEATEYFFPPLNSVDLPRLEKFIFLQGVWD